MFDEVCVAMMLMIPAKTSLVHKYTTDSRSDLLLKDKYMESLQVSEEQTMRGLRREEQNAIIRQKIIGA